MDATGDGSSQSPWNRLPTHIWETIFSLLPVSTLAVATSVCQSWRLLIQSRTFITLYPSLPHPDQDLYFLLFSDRTRIAAYRPLDDRWVSLSLQGFLCSISASCCGVRRVHVSGGSHLLVERNNGSMVVWNLFTGRIRSLAAMISVYFKPYALTLIEEDSENYSIVAVSTMDRVRSQVYDSGNGSWIMKGEFWGQFAVLGDSAWLDGILYCLTRAPDCLLAFDMRSGKWSLVNVVLPSLACWHILAHMGSLYLAGGMEELGDISRIGIWELDWKEETWKDVGFMPDGLFRRFCGFELNHFEIIDRRGIVCFCNAASYNLVMCDLSGMRWWRLAPCPFPMRKNNESWIGHALEPCVGVIRPSD